VRHAGVAPPLVLGHEFVGEVVEVGHEVSRLEEGLGEKHGTKLTRDELAFAPGERVIVQPKACRYQAGVRLAGRALQHVSFSIPGAFSQYVRIPAELIQSRNVLRVPVSVPDEDAALVEPAACVLESIFATPHVTGVAEDGRHIVSCGIKAQGRTLIIGSGTLALIYARIAKLEGAREINLIVRSEAKARVVQKLLGASATCTVFADHTRLPLAEKMRRERGLVELLRSATDGELFDDVVLAVPSTDAQRYAFELLSTTGYGVVSMFAGLQQRSESADVDRLHYRNAKAIGMSGCSTRTMTTVLRWIEHGRISLRDLCAPQHYTLDDDPAEFFQVEASGLKPMLYPCGPRPQS